MTELEREQRAKEAQRLLDEPLFKEWLAEAEADTINCLLGSALDDHTARLAMALKIEVIRQFPEFLRRVKLQAPRAEKARSIA